MSIDIDKKVVEKAFLVFLIVLGVFYLYMASMTPFKGEDEIAYLRCGEQLAELKYPAALSPLVPLVYAPFFVIFPEMYHLAIAKMVVCAFGFATLFVVYRIGKKHGVMAGIFSVTILLSMRYFTHYMMLSYVEIPIAFFSALVVYLALKIETLKHSIILGVVLALGFYTKASGIILIMAVLLYAFILLMFYDDKKYFKLAILACIISGLLITPYAIRNMMIFNYPYVEGLNMFFTPPQSVLRMATGELVFFEKPTHSYYRDAASMTKPHMNYIDTIGELALLLAFMGAVYGISTRYRAFRIPITVCFLFTAAFLFMGGESRYFSIIYPQIAIIGGIFLGEVTDIFKNDKKQHIIVSVILVAIVGYLSLSSSLAMAIQTSHSERYSPEYKDALRWMRNNTPDDSYIFTVYGGSTYYYAKRDAAWNIIPEFPLMMEPTSNSTYIYETLKKYGITHIFIDRGLVAESYFVPHLNIVGLFSTHFVNSVMADFEHYTAVYVGEGTAILELK